MIRIAIDFECSADRWWDSGGRELWESLVEGFDGNSVLLDPSIADSVMQQASAPPIIARSPSRERSPLRLGARPPMPPI